MSQPYRFCRKTGEQNENLYVSCCFDQPAGQTFKVKFAVKDIALAPAGDQTKNTGHHHLLIDVDKLPAETAPIPVDANHMHFGKAQTEAEVKLAPGKHTLQLELGDKGHVPFDPPIVSKKITVTVE